MNWARFHDTQCHAQRLYVSQKRFQQFRQYLMDPSCIYLQSLLVSVGASILQPYCYIDLYFIQQPLVNFAETTACAFHAYATGWVISLIALLYLFICCILCSHAQLR